MPFCSHASLPVDPLQIAPMSTTSRLRVALDYSESESHALVLQLRVTSFYDCGVSVQFLSAFPEEEERLYPPLTYLKPTGKTERVIIKDGKTCTFVEVEARFGAA